jgi:DNA-binding SARP family transcriptional activator
VRIGLLGPVTAGPDGTPAPGGPMVRGALARLALDAGRPVGTETLVDALWGDAPPDTVVNALQVLVSRLRRALGADLVERAPGGYRLAVDPQEVDALRFGTLVAQARRAEPAQARALLAEATGLWRGPALADVRRLPFAGPAADRLEQRRHVADQVRADRAEQRRRAGDRQAAEPVEDAGLEVVREPGAGARRGEDDRLHQHAG